MHLEFIDQGLRPRLTAGVRAASTSAEKKIHAHGDALKWVTYKVRGAMEGGC